MQSNCYSVTKASIRSFLKFCGPRLQGFEDSYQSLLEALQKEGLLGHVERNEGIDKKQVLEGGTFLDLLENDSETLVKESLVGDFEDDSIFNLMPQMMLKMLLQRRINVVGLKVIKMSLTFYTTIILHSNQRVILLLLLKRL